jgi:hypothetical protein
VLETHPGSTLEEPLGPDLLEGEVAAGAKAESLVGPLRPVVLLID